MTPEEKSLLENTQKLALENNAILRKMRRSARISSLFHVFYWIVIIVLTFGSYYFIQPYVNMLPTLLGAAGGDPIAANNASKLLQDLLSK